MTRYSVMFTGLGALAVVALAAKFYVAIDPVAFGITLVMGGAIVAALVELVARTRHLTELWGALRDLRLRAASRKEDKSDLLAREAAAEDLLATASPDLAGFLRATVERMAPPTTQAVFTPYIVGLLIALGLLGTCLGLLDTVGGARDALLASGDVDALRNGLARPMQGLMRSFGTTAAGVASSVMLGLSLVFVRRLHGQFFADVHRFSAQYLAVLTPTRRQLTALAALAEQGRSLPAAATALSTSVDALQKLSSQMRDDMQRTSQAMTQQMGAAVAKMTAETNDRILPEIKRTLEGVASETTAHMAELRQHLSTEADQRRGWETKATERMQMLADENLARTKALISSWEKSSAQLLSTNESQFEKLLAARNDADERWLEKRDKAESDLLGFLQNRFDVALDKMESQWRERNEEVSATFEARIEREQAVLDALAQAALKQQEAESELLLKVEARVSEVVEAEKVRAEALHAQAKGMASELEQASQLLQAQVREAADMDARRGEQLDTLVGSFGETVGRIQATAEKQLDALTEFASSTDERAQDTLARTDQRFTTLVETVQASMAEQQARLGNFERQLADLHAQSVEALGEKLVAQARDLSAGLEATSSVLKEAADLVLAGGAEMTSVAEMFADAVDRQREGAKQWFENLGAVEHAVEAHGREAAVDMLSRYLTRSHELFDSQLKFQRALFEQVQDLRGQAPNVSAMSTPDTGGVSATV